MEFSLEWTDIILGVITLAGVVFNTAFTTIKQANLKKKLQRDQQQEKFEAIRSRVVSAYLGCAKAFLTCSENEALFSDFAKAASEIMMYLPEDRKEVVQELNDLMDQIVAIKLGYGGDGYQRRKVLEEKAMGVHRRLCEALSDLGVKPA